ncbi:MAG: dihydroorotase family protein [Promethearchaeota archaeon]|nr:MAG: dihydroorotase family protein [Candidatus Lokiarchaeota archaeon]
MILKNAKIYSEGLLHKGAILIANDIIKTVIFNPQEKNLKKLAKKNQDHKEIDCQNKLILPGIIDIHSHLRDMDQSEKETFLTGTKAAAFSGITTVFNMPNTKPPAITTEQIKLWMKKAENNIYVDVGFIAGVPKGFDEEEIKNIVNLGILGFKIYPLNSLNEINWKDSSNLQKLFNISSKFHTPIFIHASYPLSELEKEQIDQEFNLENFSILEYHNRLDPVKAEEKYVKYVIENYIKYVNGKPLDPKDYPIIHFCHVSCIDSYLTIKKAQTSNKDLKISFEVTPHHLLLSNTILLSNDNFGKVLPPLRKDNHSRFLFNELKEGSINLIGTDHAPHTLDEKSQKYSEAPSGFPGFETYPLLILYKVFKFQLPLENFVRAASENPAEIFSLKNKGFIREGYDADLLIVDKIPEYIINPHNFKTKAKYTPFEKFSTTVYIWKVFLRGIEINVDNSIPNGKIIRRML